MPARFLPTCDKDLKKLKWNTLDVILVTGDAYVDHPSYGASLVGRVLEDAGFRVGIIAQPDWKNKNDFLKLGRPRLFFGITAGNLDSMVANYTANRKPRGEDEYSPGGKSGLRPDRASIVYSNRVREAYRDVPIILGGMEASLRRLAHYDYWSDKVRRSVLFDAKADMLIYGMGETQILEIARLLKGGRSIKDIDSVRGTVVIKKSIEDIKDRIEIPSFEEVNSDKDKFNEAFKIIYREADPFSGKAIAQKHGDRYAIQLPAALPLKTEELDNIYSLDYANTWHPDYDKYGGVPGFETVRFSITSHRGCCGECSFCSLYLHQGRIVQSRSVKSVVEEAARLAARKDFRGTITDVGGPTANLYAAACELWDGRGACRDKSCLTPSKCKGLKLGYEKTVKLWRELAGIPGVNNVFIGTGVRYDLLIEPYSDEYLKELCAKHVSGQLKVAPESASNKILGLMNKPPFELYEKFVSRYNDINKKLGKKQYLVNYFISGHPGAGLEDELMLAEYLLKHRMHPEQAQDYLPLPMTPAGCMYHTLKNPLTGKEIYVAKGERERKLHRALIQYYRKSNKRYVIEALKKLNRKKLIKKFYQ